MTAARAETRKGQVGTGNKHNRERLKNNSHVSEGPKEENGALSTFVVDQFQ